MHRNGFGSDGCSSRILGKFVHEARASRTRVHCKLPAACGTTEATDLGAALLCSFALRPVWNRLS